jgi:ubiquitin-activating enzyme E1
LFDCLAKEMADAVDDEFESKVSHIICLLPSPSSLAGYHLYPIEFEKDNENNFHISFITASSNLRARNYSIKEVSSHETKFIAGKIIPAIATTTALVTGIVCLEIYKLALGKNQLEQYRNFSCNLALPFFSASEPIAPATQQCMLKTGEWKWSLWDRIDIAIGDSTLEELIHYFQNTYGLEINMLSHGASMLYFSFNTGAAAKKKAQERLKMKMTELVTSVSHITLNEKDRYLILEACVNNEEGDDVDIPYVRYKFRD